MQAIKNFREPKNIDELRSFLGLVIYVGKFIADFASHTDNLRSVLKARELFWNASLSKSFEVLKNKLSEDALLGYYNPNDLTRVIAVAS